jgi:hypothetical protein
MSRKPQLFTREDINAMVRAAADYMREHDLDFVHREDGATRVEHKPQPATPEAE